jgi:hypothetical protein
VKKTSYILLGLLGSVTVLNGIERQPDVVRDVYNSHDDCVKDNGEAQCRQETAGHGGSGGSGGRWFGPNYRNDSTARRSYLATGHETVQRGGFGFSGRRMFSGS